ncbi:MAG: SH3 domain-containing protein [Candidatus Omnitrophica bacterium]|nr:SH3 domain-containing protein [Candidatus Omnitrophota bacterium]
MGSTRPPSSFPFVGEVASQELNIRAGQSENFEKVGRLQKGEEVVVVAESYGWYKIVLPAQSKSYVSKDYVKVVGKNLGEVTGTRVNVRGGPGTNFSVLAQLHQGDAVRILEEKEGWYLIEPPDQGHGWVAAQYVQFKSSSVPTKQPIQDALKTEVAQLKSGLFADATSSPLVASEEDAVITASGVLDDLGSQALSQEVRHHLVLDGQVLYLLKGYRMLLDGFLHQKVKIEGKIQPDMKSSVPVVLVTKITLVL